MCRTYIDRSTLCDERDGVCRGGVFAQFGGDARDEFGYDVGEGEAAADHDPFVLDDFSLDRKGGVRDWGMGGGSLGWAYGVVEHWRVADMSRLRLWGPKLTH